MQDLQGVSVFLVYYASKCIRSIYSLMYNKMLMTMKKTKMILLLCLCALLPALLCSCDDDDHYSLGDFTPPLWATVRTQGGTAFYLDCDVWGTLWPVNTNLGGYEAVDGQRVITSFNPLADNYEGFDHAVKILTLQHVLTKQLELLSPDNAEEYGNDPLLIYQGDMCVSGGYLNLLFLQNLPAKEKHRISLVQDEADRLAGEEDGYLHCQLRYNTFGDLTGYRAYGAVSFHLGDLPEGCQGVKVVLQSEKNGEVEVTFDLQSAANSNQQKVDTSGMKLR